MMQTELEFTSWADMTIAERVLYMLRHSAAVTTSEFLQAGLYTFRNRISELRRRGVRIEQAKVEGKSIYRYWMEEGSH